MGPFFPSWRRYRAIEYLSRIRVGVSLMAAILIYACIASALPQVRGALEMTEMEIFRHWLFGAMIFLFTVSLVLATLTRVSWSVVNAGVWIVHTGLLLLVGGSVWYFSTKVEGDTLLVSPKVQVVSIGSGGERVIAHFLAEPGQSWESVMPAFGGEVRVAVDAVSHRDTGEMIGATVTVTSGGKEDRVQLAVGQDAEIVPGRLTARLAGGDAVDRFYDGDLAALYVRPSGGAHGLNDAVILPIEGLPYYRERYLDDGEGALTDAAGRTSSSKRSSPELKLAGLRLPTSWFESWRMPIRLESGDLPFSIEVTGYVPYVSRMEPVALEGGDVLNPAAQIRLALGETFIDESLFALDPARSAMARGLPVEFRWFESEAEMHAAFAPLAGPNELYVEIKDPPFAETFAVTAGQAIRPPGTNYEITVRDFQATWPLMTPGFEGASSPMASVDVKREGKTYNRTVIQRFPELSQDIDESGVRHREGPYDANLVLRYRTSAQGRALIAAGPGYAPRVAVFDAAGSVKVTTFSPGIGQRVELMGTPLDLTLRSYAERALEALTPVIEPLERRRPNIAARSASAVRLRFTPRGGGGEGGVTRWCLFSQYPHAEANVVRVRPPGASEDYEIVYSRQSRPLGCALVPRKLSVTFFPGRQNVESWRSDFLIRSLHEGTNPAAVYTNQTCVAGDWTLFQSGAAGDHWSYTILGVGNRNGIWTMVLGCALVTIGSLYAFYVKPALIRRRKGRGIENGELRMMKDDGAFKGAPGTVAPSEVSAAIEEPAGEPEEVGA